MSTAEVRELLRPNVLWVLWLALTASIWIYVAVAFFVASGEAEPAEVAPLLPTIFAALSVAAGGSSLLLRRLLCSDERLRGALEAPVDPEALARGPNGQIDEERRRRIEQLPETQRKLLGVAPVLFVGTIVPLALNEAIALFGLVLAFLARDASLILPFAIVATGLNLVSRPPIDDVLERASRLVR